MSGGTQLATLDVSGNASFAGTVKINNLVVSGHVVVGADTAGTATVIIGQSSVDIQFSKPYKTIPIVTTSTSAFTLVSVTRKTTADSHWPYPLRPLPAFLSTGQRSSLKRDPS